MWSSEQKTGSKKLQSISQSVSQSTPWRRRLIVAAPNFHPEDFILLLLSDRINQTTKFLSGLRVKLQQVDVMKSVIWTVGKAAVNHQLACSSQTEVVMTVSRWHESKRYNRLISVLDGGTFNQCSGWQKSQMQILFLRSQIWRQLNDIFGTRRKWWQCLNSCPGCCKTAASLPCCHKNEAKTSQTRAQIPCTGVSAPFNQLKPNQS